MELNHWVMYSTIPWGTGVVSCLVIVVVDTLRLCAVEKEGESLNRGEPSNPNRDSLLVTEFCSEQGR